MAILIVHFVGCSARSLYFCHNAIFLFINRDDLPLARIAAPATEPARINQTLQCRYPAFCPPTGCKRAAFAARFDAIFDFFGFGWFEIIIDIVPRSFFEYRITRITRSFLFFKISAKKRLFAVHPCSFLSATFHLIRPLHLPSAFLDSIISSIISSNVPVVTNLCTCTFRFCPMRKTRSVA